MDTDIGLIIVARDGDATVVRLELVQDSNMAVVEEIHGLAVVLAALLAVVRLKTTKAQLLD